MRAVNDHVCVGGTAGETRVVADSNVAVDGSCAGTAATKPVKVVYIFTYMQEQLLASVRHCLV